MSEEKHTFNDKEAFTEMRNAHLNRVLEEIDNLLEKMKGEVTARVDCTKKEISFLIIGTLIRKCIELNILNEKKFKNDFNSIMHSHLAIHMKDGSFFIKSDGDIKYGRTGVLISIDYIESFKAEVVEWINTDL